MAGTLLDDLKDRVATGQALFIVGAGVSMAATNGAPCANWKGLLLDGLDKCVDLDGSLKAKWRGQVDGLILSDDLDMLLSAAELISGKLGAPNGGEWKRWLRESVGAMKASNRDVIEALRDLNVPLATTNYDNLLTEVTGRPPVIWMDGDKIQRVVRGDDKGILHLHGLWDRSESLVLGIRSYEKVLGDKHAHIVQHALSFCKTLVFVGFGEGLADPNFGALLDWMGKVLPGSEYRHYRLARESEVTQLQAGHPPEQRVFVVSFGKDHPDLAPFLRSL